MNSEVWYQHALANRLQTLILLTAMGTFLTLLGLQWGSAGIFWLLLLGSVLLLFNPISAPWLIMRMYRAIRLTPGQAPALYSTLVELARRADLPKVPELYYIPSSMINAFTVGSRNEAAIAVTDGLLRNLETREKVGVLAHEVSHVYNNDTKVMGIADMFSRLTNLLSLFGQLVLLLKLSGILFDTNINVNWLTVLLLIFAPTLSALAQLGLSRTREHDADLNAARLTGDPEGLASALVKIEQYSGSLFERILLPGRRIPEPSLLRTHPPTQERVRRLMELRPPAIKPSMLLRPHMRLTQEPSLVYLVRRPPHWHVTGIWH